MALRRVNLSEYHSAFQRTTKRTPNFSYENGFRSSSVVVLVVAVAVSASSPVPERGLPRLEDCVQATYRKVAMKGQDLERISLDLSEEGI